MFSTVASRLPSVGLPGKNVLATAEIESNNGASDNQEDGGDRDTKRRVLPRNQERHVGRYASPKGRAPNRTKVFIDPSSSMPSQMVRCHLHMLWRSVVGVRPLCNSNRLADEVL